MLHVPQGFSIETVEYPAVRITMRRISLVCLTARSVA
jgi:hypothetical protein